MSADVTRDLIVVGAGPVGLTTALRAAQAGLDVEVIDREWRIAARSYSCALHPRTLEILDQLGVLARVLELGVRVETVAFYEGANREAEVRLGTLSCPYPFSLLIYQDDLEGVLEDALRDQFSVKIQWGRRLEAIDWHDDSRITAMLERLEHRPTGDPQHQWQEIVDRRIPLSTRFLVGADGEHSKLAHLLGTGSEAVDDPTTYSIYEFEPLFDPGREIRIAFHAETTNVFWPLPGGACRWSLESPRPGSKSDRTSDVTATRVLEAPVGGGGSRRLLQRIQEVAPWFGAGVHHLDWAMRLEFPRRLAHQFGRGGCWLMGDSAHQTAPGGAQSMNLGFSEAVEWVGAAQRILRQNAPSQELTDLAAKWEHDWRRLLGLTPGLKATPAATPWVAAHADRILSCLPVSGSQLIAALDQVGLQWTDEPR